MRPRQVQTPLATCTGAELARPVIVAFILLAGFGTAKGIGTALPDAGIGHNGLFRNAATLRPQWDYLNLCPTWHRLMCLWLIRCWRPAFRHLKPTWPGALA